MPPTSCSRRAKRSPIRTAARSASAAPHSIHQSYLPPSRISAGVYPFLDTNEDGDARGLVALAAADGGNTLLLRSDAPRSGGRLRRHGGRTYVVYSAAFDTPRSRDPSHRLVPSLGLQNEILPFDVHSDDCRPRATGWYESRIPREGGDGTVRRSSASDGSMNR